MLLKLSKYLVLEIVFYLIVGTFLIYLIYGELKRPSWNDYMIIKKGHVVNESIDVFVIKMKNEGYVPAFSIYSKNRYIPSGIFVRNDTKLMNFYIRVEYCNLKTYEKIGNAFLTDAYCNLIGWMFNKPKIEWDWEYAEIFR